MGIWSRPDTLLGIWLVSLGKNAESMGNTLPPLTPHTWTDNKQKQRKALKKLAQGHKLQSEQEQEMDLTM